MLLLIDCKYKLEERQDVRKYYKVTSLAAPIQGDTEEKEGLLSKEENGITDMEVKENGRLHDERIQMENPDRDKEVSICLVKRGNQVSFWPLCNAMTVATFLTVMHGGWAIVPLGGFGANNTNCCCNAFTAQ